MESPADLLTVDLHTDLITYERAAELVTATRRGLGLADVPPRAIRLWVHRGRLPKRDTPDGPRVLGIDLLKAEAATRRYARPAATARVVAA